MTTQTIEDILKIKEGTNLEGLHIEREDLVEIDDMEETVIESTYEEGKLLRFKTAKRDGDAIVRSEFNAVAVGGRNRLGSGIFYGEDHDVNPTSEGNGKKPYTIFASTTYSELNAFLRRFGR